MPVDWSDNSADAVDGFTVGEISEMVHESVVDAVCQYCQGTQRVEPDAQNYNCHGCGAREAVTSPLVKLGLI